MDNAPINAAGSASRWSAKTFLTLLVLACLLPAACGTLMLLAYEYRNSRIQQSNDTIRTARALVQAVDNHLLRSQAVAQTLSISNSLRRQDFARFHEEALAAVKLAGLGSNVVLRDEAGRQILNTAIPFGESLPARAADTEVEEVFSSGANIISDVFIGPAVKRPMVSVYVPVEYGGRVKYALAVGVPPEQLNRLLKSQGLPAEWVAAVFDSGGSIVGRTRSSEQFIGQKANARLLGAMQNAVEGSLETTTRDGAEVVSFYSRSPVTGWGVAIGIPREGFAAALARPLAMLAAGLAALFGISLILARFMGTRIAGSVQALTAPANALGKGGSVPVPVVHIREAAEVAAAMGRASELLHAKEVEVAEAHRLAKFGTWHYEFSGAELTMSQSTRDICGCNVTCLQDLRGMLLDEDAWNSLRVALRDAESTGRGHDLEMQVRRRDGHPIWVNFKCEAVRNAHGRIVALRGTVQDITERRQADERLRDSEERLRNAALHDSLTGLPNRAFVFEYCGRLLAAAQRSHGKGALLFIDLDRFKPINDLYGHETGDRVLQEVGRRLRGCTRQEDLVGRLGGDEFVIVLPQIDEDWRRAAIVAQHVIESISLPYQIGQPELSISPSVGISHFPAHATTVGALVHAADLAMYHAKQSGRANYQVYSHELDRRAERAFSVEVRLRNALKQGRMQLHYQPVIDIRSGRLIGAEALVRMDDNDCDPVSPAVFIPVAEASGLIGELGEWVAAEACRQQEAWRCQGLKLTMAINVSPLQFRRSDFADKLDNIISSTGIDPSYLEIEVTESAVMDSLDDAVVILNRIKALGVKVALDDFGTGYSSLSSLTTLPLDKLKVDQSFVRRIEGDRASCAVTDAILALGRSLKLDVHGEGIESERALLYLEEHGCDHAQGYWFSRPLPASKFMQWYRDQWSPSRAMSEWRGRG